MTHPTYDYIDGVCESVEKCDVDTINSIELVKLARGLGYRSFKVWYLQPGFSLQHGCRHFSNDSDVVRFLDEHIGADEITFYIETLTDVPGSLSGLVIDDDDEVQIVPGPEVT